MAEIIILGTGCDACDQVAAHAKQALRDADEHGSIRRVTDVLDITAYKVSRTPAVVINDNVVCSGRIPSVDEIRIWLESHK